MLELPNCYTREFVPSFFEREIRSSINGICSIPPHHDPSTYRLININVSLSGFTGSTNTAPFCVLSRSSTHDEYARTEVQWYNVNAKWIRPFTLCFRRGEPELLFFDIYDVVSTTDTLSAQEFLGSCQLDLNSLLDSPKHSISLEVLRHQSSTTLSKLDISYFDINPICHGSLHFRLELDLQKPTGAVFRRIAPYFEVSRLCPFSHFLIPVFKSAVSADRKWDKLELLLQFLCGGDLDEVIRVQFFDFVTKGRNSPIGFVDTTVRVFCSKTQFDIHSDRGDHVGRLLIAQLGELRTPRFQDYRLKGVQIAPMLAIDFSSSYIGFLTTNRVQHISNGLLTYGNLINGVFDNLRHVVNHKWRAFGFADFVGKKIMPLSINKTQRQMKSVKNLMASYWAFRERTAYPESAALAPVFAEARVRAKREWTEHRCLTLVIVLTNGRFGDLRAAIDELVDAEREPIIVVMVTIGGVTREVEAAFHTSEGGGGLVHSDGRVSRRLMVAIISYEKNCWCADNALETRMVWSIHKMGLEWIEQYGFE